MLCCALNLHWIILLQKYHPSRVFTIVYEPFALITTLIYLRYEARASTRWRVLSGLVLFIVAITLAIVVSLSTLFWLSREAAFKMDV